MPGTPLSVSGRYDEANQVGCRAVGLHGDTLIVIWIWPCAARLHGRINSLQQLHKGRLRGLGGPAA
jgi:hypothetical protein